MQTLISMQRAFELAASERMRNFPNELLSALSDSLIRATSAFGTKSNLEFFRNATLNGLISRLPVSEASRALIKRKTKNLVNPKTHILIKDRYITIVKVGVFFEAYLVGDFFEASGARIIFPSLWEKATIDTINWNVIFEDYSNSMRYVENEVSFDGSDLSQHFGFKLKIDKSERKTKWKGEAQIRQAKSYAIRHRGLIDEHNFKGFVDDMFFKLNNNDETMGRSTYERHYRPIYKEYCAAVIDDAP